jgi:hypothetical protein
VILLASGDAFLLSQEAGNGNVYSYTATADLIILNWGSSSVGNIALGTWVNATSGVYVILGNPDNALRNGQNKIVVTSGSTLYSDNVDINNYGICIGGIEL